MIIMLTCLRDYLNSLDGFGDYYVDCIFKVLSKNIERRETPPSDNEQRSINSVLRTCEK